MMRLKKSCFFAVLSIFLSACAGKLDYFPPQISPILNNSITLDKSKDDAWKTIIPALGKHFFVINNLDKESGIINISYNGDPEKYVDCGKIHSYVKNAAGERNYDFQASSAYQKYEIMDMKNGGTLFFVERKMNLDGRMNIIVEKLESNKTLITLNTKYVLTKNFNSRTAQGFFNSGSDTISFNTGQDSQFPGGVPTICRATGNLEKEVLSILLNQ